MEGSTQTQYGYKKGSMKTGKIIRKRKIENTLEN